MNILQMVTLVGCGGILSVALLLWFLAHKAAAINNRLEASFTRLLALFCTGVSGGLLVLAFSLPL